MAKAKKLRRYMVTAEITGRKFLGYFEAESAEAAIAQAEKKGDLTVGLCHQCAEEVESADVGELFAEEVEREQEARGIAGDRCEAGNECGRAGCPECQQ